MNLRPHRLHDTFIPHTCTSYIAGGLLGFTNLGEIDTLFTSFKRSLEEGSSESQPLAKSMLVIMVRELYSSLQFPYVQFLCTSVRGDQLFTLFWDAVARLGRYGVKVLGLTCNGLSANHRLFRIHNSSGNAEFTYKIPNPYASESRFIYFISDPPHLIKTVRNCWASKNRQLWVSVYRCMYSICVCICVLACLLSTVHISSM